MERRYLALMFTDIVGYSKLMGQNESQTIALVEEYRRILLAKIDEYEGQVIEFIGDAVFARFDSVLKSVQAGIAIQNALRDANQQREASAFKLRSRIGIHAGDVTLKNGALFGDDVNIAARLEPLAVADGIAVSSAVYDAVKKHINVPVKRLGKQSLKNIQHKTRVYLLKPDGIRLSTHAHYALRTFNQFVAKQRYPIAACIIALFIAGYYFIPRWLVPGYTANYVEIADFKNLMSEDGQADYFSAGITEALRSQLADIDDVYILEADKGIRAPVRLEGSVQRAGDNLRIAYRLFRREDNVQIAGGKLDGSYSDIFILQDRVVTEIARYIATEFKLPNFRPPSLVLTNDVTAYDYYLRGLEQLKHSSTEDAHDEAIRFMSTALVHDEGFALANAGICRAYLGKYDFSRRVELLSKAEKYCDLAWLQDDENIEILVALVNIYSIIGKFESAQSLLAQFERHKESSAGLLRAKAKLFYKLGKLDASEELYKKALSDYSSEWLVYADYGTHLIDVGKFDEAIKILKSGLTITPENEVLYNNIGGAYFYLGDYRNAAEAFEQAVNLFPSAGGYSNSGTLYYYASEFESSKKMFQEAINLAPQDFRLYVNIGDAVRQLEGVSEKSQSYYFKAIKYAAQVVQLNPNNVEAYQFLIIAYLFVGDDVERSRRYVELAKKLAPQNMGAAHAALRHWVHTKKWDSAMIELENLLSLGYLPNLLISDPDLKVLREQYFFKVLIGESSINVVENKDKEKE